MIEAKNSCLKNLTKAIALVTSVCLLWQDVVFAQGGTPIVWPETRKNSQRIQSPETNRFALPPDMASQRSSYQAPGDEVILNIQDAHASIGAQKSIASILGKLVESYDLKLVGLEGSTGAVDPSLVSVFPDEKVRRHTAETLLRKSQISAGEFYKIISGKDVELLGIEDKPLYDANARSFKMLSEEKERVQAVVEAILTLSANLSQKIFKKEIQDLDAIGFGEGGDPKNFAAHWERMRVLADRASVDHAAFKNIRILNRSVELESKINFQKAEIERDKLIKKLKEVLDKKSFEALAVRTMQFKMAQVTPAEFHSDLVDWAQRFNLPTEGYENLILYAQYVSAFEEADLFGILTETEALKALIKEKLFTEKDERDMDRLRRNLKILCDFLGGVLSASDYEYFRSNEKDFAVKKLSDDLRALADRYAVGGAGDADWDYIADRMEQAKTFYEGVKARDSALVRNLVAGMRERKLKASVLISGGFHSEGIPDLLDQKRISSIVLMPKFSTEEGERPYLAIITQKGSWIDLEEKRKARKEAVALVLASAMREGIPFERAKKTYAQSYENAIRAAEGVGVIGPDSAASPDEASLASPDMRPSGLSDRYLALQSIFADVKSTEGLKWLRGAAMLNGRILVGGLSIRAVYDPKTGAFSTESRPATSVEKERLKGLRNLDVPIAGLMQGPDTAPDDKVTIAIRRAVQNARHALLEVDEASLAISGARTGLSGTLTDFLRRVEQLDSLSVKEARESAKALLVEADLIAARIAPGDKSSRRMLLSARRALTAITQTGPTTSSAATTGPVSVRPIGVPTEPQVLQEPRSGLRSEDQRALLARPSSQPEAPDSVVAPQSSGAPAASTSTPASSEPAATASTGAPGSSVSQPAAVAPAEIYPYLRQFEPQKSWKALFLKIIQPLSTVALSSAFLTHVFLALSSGHLGGYLAVASVLAPVAVITASYLVLWIRLVGWIKNVPDPVSHIPGKKIGFLEKVRKIGFPIFAHLALWQALVDPFLLPHLKKPQTAHRISADPANLIFQSPKFSETLIPSPELPLDAEIAAKTVRWLSISEKREALHAEELRAAMIVDSQPLGAPSSFAEIPRLATDISGLPILVRLSPNQIPMLMYSDRTWAPAAQHQRDRFGNFIPQNGKRFAVVPLSQGYRYEAGQPIVLTLTGDPLLDINGVPIAGPITLRQGEFVPGYWNPDNPNRALPSARHNLVRKDMVLVNSQTLNPVIPVGDNGSQERLDLAKRNLQVLQNRILLFEERTRKQFLAVEPDGDYKILTSYRTQAELDAVPKRYFSANPVTGVETEFDPDDPATDPRTKADVIRNRNTGNEILFVFQNDPKILDQERDAGRVTENFLAGFSLDTVASLGQIQRQPVPVFAIVVNRQIAAGQQGRYRILGGDDPSVRDQMFDAPLRARATSVRQASLRILMGAPSMGGYGIPGPEIEKLAGSGPYEYQVPNTQIEVITNDSGKFDDEFLRAVIELRGAGPFAVLVDHQNRVRDEYPNDRDADYIQAMQVRRDLSEDAPNSLGAPIRGNPILGIPEGWVIWRHLGAEFDERGDLVKAFDDPSDLLKRINQHHLKYRLDNGRLVDWTGLDENSAVIEIFDPLSKTRIRTGRGWLHARYVLRQSVRLEHTERSEQAPRTVLPESLVGFAWNPQLGNLPTWDLNPAVWDDPLTAKRGLNVYIGWLKAEYLRVLDDPNIPNQNKPLVLQNIYEKFLNANKTGIFYYQTPNGSTVEVIIKASTVQMIAKGQAEFSQIQEQFLMDQILIRGGQIRVRGGMQKLRADLFRQYIQKWSAFDPEMPVVGLELPARGMHLDPSRRFDPALGGPALPDLESKRRILDRLERLALEADRQMNTLRERARFNPAENRAKIRSLEADLRAERNNPLGQDLDHMRRLEDEIRILNSQIERGEDDLARHWTRPIPHDVNDPNLDINPQLQAFEADPIRLSDLIRQQRQALAAEIARHPDPDRRPKLSQDTVDNLEIGLQLLEDMRGTGLKSTSFNGGDDRVFLFMPRSQAQGDLERTRSRVSEDVEFFTRWTEAMKSGGSVVDPNDRVNRAVMLKTENPIAITGQLPFREAALASKRRSLDLAKAANDRAQADRLEREIKDIEANHVIRHPDQAGQPRLVILEYGLAKAEAEVQRAEADFGQSGFVSNERRDGEDIVRVIPDDDNVPVRVIQDPNERANYIAELFLRREQLALDLEADPNDADIRSRLEMTGRGIFREGQTTVVVEFGEQSIWQERVRAERKRESLGPDQALSASHSASGIETGIWVLHHKDDVSVERPIKTYMPHVRDEEGRAQVRVLDHRTGLVEIQTMDDDARDLKTGAPLDRVLESRREDTGHTTTYAYKSRTSTRIKSATTRNAEGEVTEVLNRRLSSNGKPQTLTVRRPGWDRLFDLYDSVLGDPSSEDPKNPHPRRIVGIDARGEDDLVLHPGSKEAILWNPDTSGYSVMTFEADPATGQIRLNGESGEVIVTDQKINGGIIHKKIDRNGKVTDIYAVDALGRKVAIFGLDKKMGPVVEIVSNFGREPGDIVSQTHPYRIDPSGRFVYDAQKVFYISKNLSGEVANSALQVPSSGKNSTSNVGIFRPEEMSGKGLPSRVVDRSGQLLIRRTFSLKGNLLSPDLGSFYEESYLYLPGQQKPYASTLELVSPSGRQLIWTAEYGKPISIRDILKTSDQIRLSDETMRRWAPNGVGLDTLLLPSTVHVENGAFWTDYYLPDDALERKVITVIGRKAVVATAWDHKGDVVSGVMTNAQDETGEIHTPLESINTSQDLLDRLRLPHTNQGDEITDEIKGVLAGLGHDFVLETTHEYLYGIESDPQDSQNKVRYIRNISVKRPPVTHIRMPGDPRNSDFAVIYPSGNVLILRWWDQSAQAPSGQAPSMYLITGDKENRRVEKLVFEEAVVFADGYVDVEGHQVIGYNNPQSIRPAKEDEDAQGFLYRVLDPVTGKEIRREIYSPIGDLLINIKPYKAEESVEFVVDRKSFDGELVMRFDLNSDHPRAVDAVTYIGGSKREAQSPIRYFVDPLGRQVEAHEVKVHHPAAPNGSYTRTYNIVDGNETPSTVKDPIKLKGPYFGASWQVVSLLSILTGAFFVMPFIILFVVWLFVKAKHDAPTRHANSSGLPSRYYRAKKPKTGPDSSGQTSGSRMTPQAKQAAMQVISNLPSFGFPNGLSPDGKADPRFNSVSEVKSEMSRHIEDAQAQNSTGFLIEQRFKAYFTWLDQVFYIEGDEGVEGAYQAERDRTFTWEDYYLMELIRRESGSLEQMPDYLHWIFYATRQKLLDQRKSGVADDQIDIYTLPTVDHPNRWSVRLEIRRMYMILATHTLTWNERRNLKRPFQADRFLSQHGLNEQYRLPTEFLRPLIFGNKKEQVDRYADLLIWLFDEPQRRLGPKEAERDKILNLIRTKMHDEANAGMAYLEVLKQAVDEFLNQLPPKDRTKTLQEKLDALTQVERTGDVPFRLTYLNKRGGFLGWKSIVSVISTNGKAYVLPYVIAGYLVLGILNILDATGINKNPIQNAVLEALSVYAPRALLDYWWFAGLFLLTAGLWVIHIWLERWNYPIGKERPIPPWAGYGASSDMSFKNRMVRVINIAAVWVPKVFFWTVMVEALVNPTQLFMRMDGVFGVFGFDLVEGLAYNIIQLISLWVPFFIFYVLDSGTGFHLFQSYFIFWHSYKVRWFAVNTRSKYMSEMRRSSVMEVDARSGAGFPSDLDVARRHIEQAVESIITNISSGARLTPAVEQRLEILIDEAAKAPEASDPLAASRRIRLRIGELLRDEEFYAEEGPDFEKMISDVKNLRVSLEELEWAHRRPPADSADFVTKAKYIFFNNTIFSAYEEEDFLRREIAWALIWNGIVSKMREERIIGDEEKSALSYKIGGQTEGDLLSGFITEGFDGESKFGLGEAQRRFNVFLSSMHNREMEALPNWDHMRTVGFGTPILEEEIMPSITLLDDVLNSGRSELSQRAMRHWDEWLDLIDELEADPYSGLEKDSDMAYALRHFRHGQSLLEGVVLDEGTPRERLVRLTDPILQARIRYWASLRYQELSRTYRGMDNIREAYGLLAHIHLAAQGRTHVPEHEIEAMVNRKLHFLVGHQRHGSPDFQKPDGKNHNLLIDMYKLQERYPWMELSYLLDEANADGTKSFYAVHLKRSKPTVDPLIQTLILAGIAKSTDSSTIRSALAAKTQELYPGTSPENLTGNEAVSALIEAGVLKSNFRSVEDVLREMEEKFESSRKEHPNPSGNPFFGAFSPRRRQVLGDEPFEIFFRALMSGENVEERVLLPGDPILLQGKPGNHVVMMKFLGKSEAIHTIDMNMDFPIEEAFKLSFAHDQMRGKRVIIGFVEHIMTVGEGIWSDVIGRSDRSFNFIQFVHDRKGIKTQYGHPDAHARHYVIQFGGISKPVELTEDVLYGKWALLLGFISRTLTPITAYKGRDGSFKNIVTLMTKFSVGAAEQSISQIDHRLNRSPLFGWTRAHINNYEGPGHLIQAVLVALAASAIVTIVILLRVSGYVSHDEFFMGAFGAFLSQTISAILIFAILLEYGLVRGGIISALIFPFVLAVFLPLLFSNAVAVWRGLNGDAPYGASGRSRDDAHYRPFLPLVPVDKEGKEDLSRVHGLYKDDPNAVFGLYRTNMFRVALIPGIFSVVALILNMGNVAIFFSLAYLLINLLVYLTPMVIANHLTTPIGGIKRSGTLLFGDWSSALKIRLRFRPFVTGKMPQYDDISTQEKLELIWDSPLVMAELLGKSGLVDDAGDADQVLKLLENIDGFAPKYKGDVMVRALFESGRLNVRDRQDLIDRLGSFLGSASDTALIQRVKTQAERSLGKFDGEPGKRRVNAISGNVELWVLYLWLIVTRGQVPSEFKSWPLGTGYAFHFAEVFLIGGFTTLANVALWFLLVPVRWIRLLVEPRPPTEKKKIIAKTKSPEKLSKERVRNESRLEADRSMLARSLKSLVLDPLAASLADRFLEIVNARYGGWIDRLSGSEGERFKANLLAEAFEELLTDRRITDRRQLAEAFRRLEKLRGKFGFSHWKQIVNNTARVNGMQERLSRRRSELPMGSRLTSAPFAETAQGEPLSAKSGARVTVMITSTGRDWADILKDLDALNAVVPQYPDKVFDVILLDGTDKISDKALSLIRDEEVYSFTIRRVLSQGGVADEILEREVGLGGTGILLSESGIDFGALRLRLYAMLRDADAEHFESFVRSLLKDKGLAVGMDATIYADDLARIANIYPEGDVFESLMRQLPAISKTDLQELAVLKQMAVENSEEDHSSLGLGDIESIRALPGTHEIVITDTALRQEAIPLRHQILQAMLQLGLSRDQVRVTLVLTDPALTAEANEFIKNGVVREGDIDAVLSVRGDGVTKMSDILAALRQRYGPSVEAKNIRVLAGQRIGLGGTLQSEVDYDESAPTREWVSEADARALRGHSIIFEVPGGQKIAWSVVTLFKKGVPGQKQLFPVQKLDWNRIADQVAGMVQTVLTSA